MAYRKQSQRILAGSLNLLPPGDKIPDGDSLVLQNWRVDQAGQLRSRKAIHPLGVVPGGATVHTLYVSGAQHEYLAAGTVLYTSFDTPAAMTGGTGFSGNPMGVASYFGCVWFMDSLKQGKVKVPSDAVRPWTPAAPVTAPTVAGSGSGGFTGDFTFWITLEDDFGHESNPSPVSGTVTADAAAQFDLSGIPTGPAYTAKRHIYRLGGDSDQALRVGTIANNSATTFTSTMTVEAAQEINVEMPLDHDPAPAGSGLVGPYFGKLIAWKGNRIYWTPSGQPWYFPGSDDASEGNWEDVGEDGDDIVSITMHKTMLVIGKERSIWRLIGDPDTNSPTQTNATIGIVGGLRAVTTYGAVDYFGGAEGVYGFDGDFEQKLTRKLDPMFHDEWTELGSGLLANPMNGDRARVCAMGAKDGRIYFSYPETGLAPNQTLVYDRATERWAQHQVDAALGASGFNAFFYDGDSGRLYGAIGPQVAILESSYYAGEVGISDGNHPIALVWQSGYYDQGAPDNPKVYADLVVEYQTATVELAQTPATLNVKLLLDYGAPQTIGTINSATRTTKTFRLGTNGEGLRGKKSAVRIDGAAMANVIIYAVYLHYYIEPRQGLSFDTGVINLGTARPKQCDALGLDVTAAAAINWRLYSDLPGGAMTLRASGTLTPTAGARVVLERALASIVDGRNYRLTLDSASAFQVWAVRLRTRPISIYVDGTVGEIWQTPDLTFGFEWAKLFGKVELHADTDGSATLDVLTDLPGNAVASRKQQAFSTEATTTGSRTQNVRLPGTTKGHLMRLKVTGSYVTRIYGGRVWGRVIGPAEAQAWAWWPIPMEETPEIFSWVDLPVDAIE